MALVSVPRGTPDTPHPGAHPRVLIARCHSPVVSCPGDQWRPKGSFTEEWAFIFSITERVHPRLQFGIKPLNCSLGFGLNQCKMRVGDEAVMER